MDGWLVFRGRVTCGDGGSGLEIDRKTAALALAHLEAQGLLVGQGPGRRRKIEMPEELVK